MEVEGGMRSGLYEGKWTMFLGTGGLGRFQDLRGWVRDVMFMRSYENTTYPTLTSPFINPDPIGLIRFAKDYRKKH